MNGYQPPKDCTKCVYHTDCIKSGKRKKANFKYLGNVWCKDFEEKRHKPPTTTSNVQRPEHIIKHIYCDISREFLEEYKAEIEKATATDIINLLEVFNKNGGNTYAIKLIKTRFKIER